VSRYMGWDWMWKESGCIVSHGRRGKDGREGRRGEIKRRKEGLGKEINRWSEQEINGCKMDDGWMDDK
jgi:hypothetical protein